jgi:hypothetical protein
MIDIPDLEDNIGNNQRHMVIALRLIRPHREDSIGAHGGGDVGRIPAIDCPGIDIMVILLRQLISYGYTKGSVLSKVESVFWDAAGKDLGWNKAEDRSIKQCILEQLNKDTQPEHTKNGSGIPTFRGLLDLQSLSGIFDHNRQFQLVNSQVVTGGHGNSEIVQDIEAHRKTWFSFDSSFPLSESFSNVFNPIGNRQTTSLHPRFLKVEYKVIEREQSIESVRKLVFEAPEIRLVNGTWNYGKQLAIYHLFVVVRVTEGESEQIRIYKNGVQLEWAQIGDFSEMKTSDAEIGDRLGVGSFLLFYYRQGVQEQHGY